MATPISPKVTASAVAGVLAAAILANINLITPDLFAGLGKWSGLVYGLVIAIAGAAAGWAKTDPLREPGAPAVQDNAAGVVTAPDLPTTDSTTTTANPVTINQFVSPPIVVPSTPPVDAAPIVPPVVSVPAPVAPATLEQ